MTIQIRVTCMKLLLAALFSALFATGAAAAETGREEAKPGGGANLGEITVTATKTATPAELLPVTAYSVDQKDIEAQPSYYMSNFGELIRDLPGVHVAQYYPWGPPWVHLRGTGYFIGRTAFLVDGVPVSPFVSQTIQNNDIKRVDVLLGPSSALYGANASGGAVNLITKSGKDRRAAKARALASGPELLICDEALNGLDTINQAELTRLLMAQVGARGLALLFISHDLSL